jgi:hypothetical protein
MNKSVKIAYRIFQIATVSLIGIGFVMAKVWSGVFIVLAMIPFWWITRRFESRIFSWTALVIFIGLAVFGLLSNVPPYLMIAGVTTSLTCFEFEDCITISTRNPVSISDGSYEKHHLKTLCLATAAGLILAEAGLFVKFSLPFGIIFLTALLIIFGLYQLFSYFKRA